MVGKNVTFEDQKIESHKPQYVDLMNPSSVQSFKNQSVTSAESLNTMNTTAEYKPITSHDLSVSTSQ